MNDLVRNLNDVQQKAVLHTDGPLAVYAGAGSGKTRVICSRIAYLIENGVPASSIMAVTFTNKAAKEMRERVEHLVGPRARSMLVSTFHSACARFLRVFAKEAGYEENFSIYDDDEQKSVLKDVFRELNVPEKHLSVPILKSKIDQYKNSGKTPEDVWMSLRIDKEKTDLRFKNYGETEQNEIVAKCYELYQSKLKKQNAMDFNDLLVNMVLLLEKNKEILTTLQRRYTHFLVDEFQDTNPIQFRLMSLLADAHKNLCIVGDDDQSIYSWRGADPSFILNFNKYFEQATIIKLEQNYRSSDKIVKGATGLIAHNLKRSPKTLWTEKTGGEPITLKSFFDAFEEAQFICQSIMSELSRGTQLSDFGILYRTNAQSRSIEDALRRKMLPYIIYGSVRFYERAEIKILLSYLRLLSNPDDDASFQRVINTPRRGFGDKAMFGLKDLAAKNSSSLVRTSVKIAYNEIDHDLGRASSAIKTITQSFEKWHEQLRNGISLAQVLLHIVADISYEEYLRQQYPEDFDERWLNVTELKNALVEFEDSQRQKTAHIEDPLSPNLGSLAAFLEETALIVEPTAKNVQAGSANAITLMTIHSSKGLEFNRVYVAGLEEGTLPHMNSIDDGAAIEEERRLMYVAMTRARNKLTLSHVKRHRFKGDVPVMKSRFLREIPADCLDTEGAAPAAMKNPWMKADAVKSSAMNTQDHVQDGDAPWQPGDRVRHKIFGVGVVQGIEKGLDGFRVDVRFPMIGSKKLIHTYLVSE